MIGVYRCFAVLGLLVLVVLYVSLIGSVIFGLGGSVLRTMGVDQIEMTFMPNTPIPRFLSIRSNASCCICFVYYCKICKACN